MIGVLSARVPATVTRPLVATVSVAQPWPKELVAAFVPPERSSAYLPAKAVAGFVAETGARYPVNSLAEEPADTVPLTASGPGPSCRSISRGGFGAGWVMVRCACRSESDYLVLP